MFFFFVGGIDQQVRRVVKSGVERCLLCGSPADIVEYDKVLKLFFVPVKRWPAEDLAIFCDNCSLFLPHSSSSSPPPPPPPLLSDPLRCRFCSRTLDPNFRFCPFCGTQL